MDKITERQANRVSRIDFWRGLSTLGYQHTQLYLRYVSALVIQSVGCGAFLHLGCRALRNTPFTSFHLGTRTHSSIYGMSALVIQSVGGGAFYTWVVAHSEIPLSRRFNDVNKTRK